MVGGPMAMMDAPICTFVDFSTGNLTVLVLQDKLGHHTPLHTAAFEGVATVAVGDWLC